VSLHLGLDLGGTNVKAAVVDVAPPGRVLATDAVPTRSQDGPDAVLARVGELGRRVLAPFGAPEAAGLGLPGHFDATSGTGVLLPNLAGSWVGRPIAGPVAAALGVPVRLVNDVRALTLAELRMGAGRGARDLVCIALGTGVGGGVVIGGKLHLGLGHAGEIGHMTVQPDGPACGCGNRGCLDRVASARSIAAAGGRADVGAVVTAAREGDERARLALERAAEAVAIAVGNAIVLLWPERVVVGGGVAAAGDALLEPLRLALARRAAVAPAARIPVVPAQLGTHAGAIGAALWSAEAPGDAPAPA